MPIYKRFSGGAAQGPDCCVAGMTEGVEFSSAPLDFASANSATLVPVGSPPTKHVGVIYDGEEVVLADCLDNALEVAQFSAFCAANLGLECAVVAPVVGDPCPPPKRTGKSQAWRNEMRAHRRAPLPIANLEIGRPLPL